VVAHDAVGTISWPRVSAKCDFRSAARFEDLLQIEVRIIRLGAKSITYAHRFVKDGQELATGEITAVCCRIQDNKPPESMPIPTAIAAKLRAFAA
jgi:4-hydroxybenzoyl-CoA thioesterase/acyl-CoA thioester hydrolase